MDTVQVYLESGEQIDLPESTPQTALRTVQPFFAQLTTESPYTLYNGPPLSLSKSPLRIGDLDPHPTVKP